MYKPVNKWSGPGNDDSPWIGPLDGDVNKKKKIDIPEVIPVDEPDTTLTAQQEAAMKEVLNNHSILEKIFDPLFFLDLTHCRLVNKTWKTVASKMMLQKNCCVVYIRFDCEENIFSSSTLYQILGGNFTKKEIPVDERLKSLNEILTISTEFPSTSFIFVGGSVERDVDARKFFDDHGAKCKSLEMTVMSEDEVWCTPKKAFKEILLQKCPNLENLAIGGFDYKWDEEKDGQLSLPMLKSFSWHSDLKYTKKPFDSRVIAHEILKGASNLELLYDVQFQTDAEIILKTGKVSQVKKLALTENTLNSDQLLEFANAKPQIEELELTHTTAYMDSEKKKKLSTATTKLLSNCVETLKMLDVTQFSRDLEIPPLPKLHKLTMGSKNPRSSAESSFPIELNLKDSFPNLSILDCSRLLCDENESWNIYFPGDKDLLELKSVSTLILSDQCCDLWIEKLHAKLCPNFTHLIVNSAGHQNRLDFMLPSVFRYLQHLETLTIQINNVPMESFCMDAAFTGILEDHCQRLRSSTGGHEHVELSIITKMRTQSPISNLTKLKTLKIKFDHSCLLKLARKPNDLPITTISSIYAFQHIHDLKVIVQFDLNCRWGKVIEKMFAPLGSFIEFEHEHDSRNE